MKSVFGSPDWNRTLAEAGPPNYTGVQLHTSAQSIPIPILWGTRRLSPNVIWQSTAPNVEWKYFNDHGGTYTFVDTIVPVDDGFGIGGYFLGGVNWLGAQYGSNDSSNSDSRWWVPMIFALCEGPIDSVPRIWDGGGSAPISFPTAAQIGNHSVALDYFQFNGTSSQAAWGFWAAAVNTGLYPGQDLAYRFTAYIAGALVDCGHNRSTPQQSFEVVRVPTPSYGAPDSYGLGTDYTPGGIIRDLLLSPQYGCGFLNGDIDSTSEIAYDTYTRAQGIYLSPLLTSQTAVTDIINRLAVESNAWIFWSGTAIMYAPLGDESVTNVVNSVTYTFTPDLTPAYDLGFGDFLTPIVVDRADPIDCFNRVRLEFSDRAASYATNPIEWKDSTLINQYGILYASNIDAQDCCDVAVAAKIVELVGKRLAYVRNHYSFTLSYRYIRVLPGTIVTLNDANLGLVALPVRIVSVDENEKGELAIVAEEFSGVLGISRPMANQVWSQTGGSVGGAASGPPIGGGLGAPIPTSGGVLVMTTPTTSTAIVLYVAGDLVTLPLTMAVGQQITFLHDQRRAPQPTPALLEDNPLTIQRPGGATYNIVDPSDGTAVSNGASTPPNSVKVRTSGVNFTLVYDGAAGLVRCLS